MVSYYRKNFKLLFISVGTLLCTVVFFSTLAHAVWLSPSDDSGADFGKPYMKNLSASSTTSVADSVAGFAPAMTGDTATSTALLPSRLVIPSLGIDAAVQRVGVGKSGAMAVPTNFTDVAWYRHGTVPGYAGNAVFDGHVDNGLGLAGVFKNLGEIKRGEEINVINERGDLVSFKVTSIDVYDYKNVPVNEIFNPSPSNDASRIVLITCDGSWVQGDKTYNERLVITAEKVENQKVQK